MRLCEYEFQTCQPAASAIARATHKTQRGKRRFFTGTGIAERGVPSWAQVLGEDLLPRWQAAAMQRSRRA